MTGADMADNRERVLRVIDLISRWAIAAIFLIAAVPKLFDPLEFAAIIGAYGIVPDSLLLAAAVIIPCMEIVLAVGLIANRNWGCYGAGVLLLMFIVLLLYAIGAGLDIDCGCFGPEDPERKAFSSLRLALARDLVMMVFLLISVWYQRYRA